MLDTKNREVSVTDLQGGQSYWRALYYFNLYRLLLGTGMVTVAVTDSDFARLGQEDPDLFLGSSAGMLILAVVSLITITSSWPSFRIQAYLQFSMDAVLITAMSYASGGIESGLNLLLIASVAAGGVVLSGRMSLFFSAFATLLALGQQIFETWLSTIPPPNENLVQVGLLGIGYFSTGWVVYWLARRFHAMEAEAQAREATTARLDRLNEVIVSKSTVGIAVVNKDKHCRLVNDQAKIMLGLSSVSDDLPQKLVDQVMDAQSGRAALNFDYRSPNTRVRVQCLHVDDEENEVVLFLEDLAQAEREARNLKLAALGRLTASVAHEIRNPLEAISHAGQLLGESPDLNEQQHKLTDIIENQTNRINTIVRSVLQLGKPGSVHRVELAVKPWLDRFASNFNASRGSDMVAVEGEDVGARVDPDQLNQILTNLCENALRHTRNRPERPLITLRCFVKPGRDTICIDVIDRGQGVSEDIRDKIFEPFFTTNHYGLGLGLFLARELAQNNQGELDYVLEDDKGRFRVTLEDTMRPASEPDLRVHHG